MSELLYSPSHAQAKKECSQLLEALADVNEYDSLPKALRFSLNTPPPESEVPELQADTNGKPESMSYEQAQTMLDAAKAHLSSGEILQHDYDLVVSEVAQSLSQENMPLSLPLLSSTVPHTSPDRIPPDMLPSDLRDDEFITYLNSTHEDEYLSALDAATEGVPPQTDNQAYRGALILSEATLKNPVSQYNWLKKHCPHVFLQETENQVKSEDKESKPASVAGSAPSGSKRESRSKRASVAEVLDDEGNVIRGFSEQPTGKGKRKREDDAYRPKGGSGGTKKRKKANGGKAGDGE